MRVYCCGPMRGYRDYNWPAFDRAKKHLQQLGYEVVSPADLDREDGLTCDMDPCDIDIRERLTRAVTAQLTCDEICLIKGWPYSLGAQAELALAKAAEMGILYYNNGHVMEMTHDLVR